MKNEVPMVRLGDYIEVFNVRNSDMQYGIDMIEGVNSQGEFCSPKAAVEGIKNGYPPKYSPAVFQEIMSQVENFQENAE